MYTGLHAPRQLQLALRFALYIALQQWHLKNCTATIAVQRMHYNPPRCATAIFYKFLCSNQAQYKTTTLCATM